MSAVFMLILLVEYQLLFLFCDLQYPILFLFLDEPLEILHFSGTVRMTRLMRKHIAVLHGTVHVRGGKCYYDKRVKQNMRKITFLYWEICPYCRQARKAMDEVFAENQEYEKIEIEWIETRKDPGRGLGYEHDFVPAMYVGEEKIYESHPGEKYDECKENVRHAFEAALA